METPSCFKCHDEEWEDEDNQAPVVDAGGPYLLDIGETLVVDASATTDPEGDSLTYTWDFDDGHRLRRRSSSSTATHSYRTSGNFTGSLTVSDGYNPPVVVPFTVQVNDVPVYSGDVWSITTTESPPQDFIITIEEYDGSLLVLKDDGVNPTKMAIGVELSGVIFWMDVGITPLGGMSWSSGSTYLANINRDSGVMAGIVLSNAGGMAFFDGRKL